MKNYPIGKGIWIWLLYRLLDHYGSFEAAAEDGKANGIKWVAIKAQDGDTTFNKLPITDARTGNIIRWDDVLLEPAIKAFKDAGIKVWLWGYNYGYRPEGEVLAIQTRLDQFGNDIEGWIWDAEAEIKAAVNKKWIPIASSMTDKINRSQKIVKGIKALYPDVTFGFTSFKYPKSHPEFPWRPWMAHADFYVPQVFWEGAHNPVQQLAEMISQYRAEEGKWGIKPKVMVPSGAAYTGNKWYATPEDIKAFSEAVVAQGFDAYNFWEWHIAATKSPIPGCMLQAIWEAPQTEAGKVEDTPIIEGNTETGETKTDVVDTEAIEKAAFTAGYEKAWLEVVEFAQSKL